MVWPRSRTLRRKSSRPSTVLSTQRTLWWLEQIARSSDFCPVILRPMTRKRWSKIPLELIWQVIPNPQWHPFNFISWIWKWDRCWRLPKKNNRAPDSGFAEPVLQEGECRFSQQGHNQQSGLDQGSHKHRDSEHQFAGKASFTKGKKGKQITFMKDGSSLEEDDSDDLPEYVYLGGARVSPTVVRHILAISNYFVTQSLRALPKAWSKL